MVRTAEVNDYPNMLKAIAHILFWPLNTYIDKNGMK